MRKAPGLLALVAVVGVAAYFGLGRGPARSTSSPETDREPRLQRADQVPPPTPPPASPAPVAARAIDPAAAAPQPAKAAATPSPAARANDSLAMGTLRELLNHEPLRAIELARQANKRAPDSPDAPERAWIVVKGLASLKRFHEARDEAAAMANRYPESSWTADAKRHMLVHPLDYPSREEQQRQMREAPQQ